MDGRRRAGPHPGNPRGDLLFAVARRAVGQGRRRRATRSTCTRCGWTATATPCCWRSTRSAPRATPATTPASTPTCCSDRRARFSADEEGRRSSRRRRDCARGPSIQGATEIRYRPSTPSCDRPEMPRPWPSLSIASRCQSSGSDIGFQLEPGARGNPDPPAMSAAVRVLVFARRPPLLVAATSGAVDPRRRNVCGHATDRGGAVRRRWRERVGAVVVSPGLPARTREPLSRCAWTTAWPRLKWMAEQRRRTRHRPRSHRRARSECRRRSGCRRSRSAALTRELRCGPKCSAIPMLDDRTTLCADHAGRGELAWSPIQQVGLDRLPRPRAATVVLRASMRRPLGERIWPAWRRLGSESANWTSSTRKALPTPRR